ncbi:MAG: hypothetical protein SGI98_10250 [Verrucomicrobiota bacterium]|nr:hypothetical protein [Verrucomicrobiota bacterium]
MSNLQVKGIDPGLYRQLGKRAKDENRSISQEVIHILKTHLSHPHKLNLKATEAFLSLTGAWKKSFQTCVLQGKTESP